MTLEEKLDHFYASVIDNATKKNLEIVEEYKNTLNKQFEDRKESANRKSETNYNLAVDNIGKEHNRKLSNESIEFKRKLNEKSSELIASLFSDLEKKIVEFMTTAEYDSLLVQMIEKAKDFSNGDEMIVYLNESDSAKKASLEDKTGVSLTMSNIDFKGGIRAVISSHNILIDYSFLTKLEEARSTFTFN